MNKDRFRNLGGFLRQIFGRRIHKVGVVGGFTCPNRDGSAGLGGCSYCNPAGSLPRTWRTGMSVTEQLARGCEYIEKRYGVDRFLAYFLDYSATYRDPDELAALYIKALEFPGISGICICTRPDCLDRNVVELLRWLSERTFLWVEIGAQTFNDEILGEMNRCHTASDTSSAFKMLHSQGILTAAHMIIGYPGSDESNVRSDAKSVEQIRCRGLKLQNLHVIKDTPLATSYLQRDFPLITLDEYVSSVVLFLENTHPSVVIQRLTGEARPSFTLAPPWSLDKQSVLRRIAEEMEKRDTWQGRSLGSSIEEVSAGYLPVPDHWGKPWNIAYTWPTA